MRTRPINTDPVKRTQAQIRNMQLELVRQRNQKSPTVAIFDLPSTPPTISIEGELAQDTTGKLWWYQEGVWRTCGTGTGFTAPSRPPSDNWPGVTITGASGTHSDDDSFATSQTNEPAASVYGTPPPHHSIWYAWTAPSSGSISFDTHGSTWSPDAVGTYGTTQDTILAVYTGATLATLTEITSNDDDPGNPPGDYTSKVTFTATAGTTYYIQISTWDRTLFGPTVLNWA